MSEQQGGGSGPPGRLGFVFRATLFGPLWREADLAVPVAPDLKWTSLEQAYASAEAACRAALAPVLARWEAEVGRRRDREEEQLTRYYERTLGEEVAGLRRTFHQVAVLRVRVQLARRATTRRQFRRELHRREGDLGGQLAGKETRAAALAAELGRRRRELSRRYESQVEVRLLATTWLPPAQEKAGRPAKVIEPTGQ